MHLERNVSLRSVGGPRLALRKASKGTGIRAGGECIPVDDFADGTCNMKMVRARLHHKTGLLARRGPGLLQLLQRPKGRRAPQIRRVGPPVSGPGPDLRFVVVLLSERHCPC